LAVFRRFRRLARGLQFPWHDRRMVRTVKHKGRKIMAQTFAHKALASVTALFASFVLISAAIGPVLPIA